MNRCLQKHTTSIYIYSYYLLLCILRQVQKNPNTMNIQQVHQKLHPKQFLLFYLNCFLFVIHLNLK